jgi:hypothetical protein
MPVPFVSDKQSSMTDRSDAAGDLHNLHGSPAGCEPVIEIVGSDDRPRSGFDYELAHGRAALLVRMCASVRKRHAVWAPLFGAAIVMSAAAGCATSESPSSEPSDDGEAQVTPPETQAPIGTFDNSAGIGDGSAGSGTSDGSASSAVDDSALKVVVRTHDGDDHKSDACLSIAARPGGGAIITGELQRLAAGRNAWTRAYDGAGDVAWTYELSTPSEGSDRGNHVVALADGSALVAGLWYSGSGSRTNHFLLQFGAAGALQAQNEGELIGDDYYLAVARDPSGALYAGGVLDGQGWLRKLGAGGASEAWSVTRGTSVSSVVVDADGTVLAAGGNGGDGWIARYSSTGSVLWSTAITGSSPAKLALTGDGFVATGAQWVRAFAADGAERWSIDPGAASRSVAVDAAGNIAYVGTGAAGLVVRSYDRSGAVRWERTMANASAADVATDASGNVLVCGNITTDGNTDILFATYSL